MSSQRKVLQIGLIVIFLLVLLLTLLDVGNITFEPIWEREARALTNGWSLFVDGELRANDFQIPIVLHDENLKGKEVRLSYTLQGTETFANSLMFRTAQKSVVVLFDGEKIYSYDGNVDARRIKLYGYVNHFVRLDDIAEGKKLEIITIGYDEKSSNTFYPVYLGSRVSQIVNLFRYDGLSLVFGLVILLTAISVVVLAITLVRHLAVRQTALAFAGIEFCAGLWIVGGSMSTQLIVHNQLILLVVGVLAMYLLPYFLTRFVITMYHIPESKILGQIVLIFPFAFVVISILQLLGLTSYYEFLTPTAIVLFVYLITLVGYSIKAYRNGNVAIKQFLIAIAFLLLSVLGELILLLLPFNTLLNALVLNLGILTFGAVLLQQVLVSVMEYVERKGKEEYLLSLVHTDDLTGLANRRAFEERMGQLRKVNREHVFVGIIVFDVNNLKIINDLKGHAAGDLLLQDVAALLKKWGGAISAVYRTGGDEFALICEPCNTEYYENLKTKIATDSATQINVATKLSLAYGEAFYGKNSAYATIDEAFAAADAGMYRHKIKMKQSEVK